MKQLLQAAGVTMLTLALFLTTGCGGGEPKPATPLPPEKIVLKFGHLADEKNTWHLGALKFKEIVEKNSGGRVEVKVYPYEQLGKENDLIISIQNGAADIGVFGENLTSFGAGKTILMATPYLLRDSAQLHKVAGGDIGKEIEAQILDKVKLRPIAYFERSPRNLTSNRPIKTPEDLKDLKIGVPNIPLFLETWKALEAKPVPVAYYDIFSSLKKGDIEAEENRYAFIRSDKLFEVQEFLNKTNHVRSWIYVCIGEKRMASLPEDLQKTILAAAKEMQKYEHELFIKDEAALENFLEDKMTFIEVDTAAFRAKSKDSILAKFDADQKALYNKVLNMK